MVEGSPPSQFIEIIRKYGRNDYDKLEYGTVKSPPPNLVISIDNVPIDFDSDDLIVPAHLLAHEREVTINGNDTTITFDHSLPTGTRVLVSSMSDGQKYAILCTIGDGA